MFLYKQYFGDPAETSYVPLGSILTCSKGAGFSRLGANEVAEVNEPALRSASEEEPIVLGSPDYMDELQDFLDHYLATEGYKFLQNASQMVAAKGIQKIMDDVNIYGDAGKIPDDYWFALCKKFNSLVMIYGGVYEELHFFRNKLNRAPKTLDEMIAANKTLAPENKWRLLPVGQSIYHMYGKDGEYNLKFVSADGLFEGVYDKAGNLLTELNDPINMGTYNYCDPANPVKILSDVRMTWISRFWGITRFPGATMESLSLIPRKGRPCFCRGTATGCMKRPDGRI